MNFTLSQMVLNLTIEREINMNILKQFFTTAVFAVLLGSGSLAMAKNPNNFSVIELEDNADNTMVYISCLETYVDVLWTNITITYRDFETPSGNYHYIERWDWDTVFTDTVTGDEWVGHGFSPGTDHAIVGKDEVIKYTQHETVRPVGDNDGPTLKYVLNIEYNIDEDGNWTLVMGPPDPNDMSTWPIRCVGPKGKKVK